MRCKKFGRARTVAFAEAIMIKNVSFKFRARKIYNTVTYFKYTLKLYCVR